MIDLAVQIIESFELVTIFGPTKTRSNKYAFDSYQKFWKL